MKIPRIIWIHTDKCIPVRPWITELRGARYTVRLTPSHPGRQLSNKVPGF